jgi:hypothetical protein
MSPLFFQDLLLSFVIWLLMAVLQVIMLLMVGTKTSWSPPGQSHRRVTLISHGTVPIRPAT